MTAHQQWWSGFQKRATIPAEWSHSLSDSDWAIVHTVGTINNDVFPATYLTIYADIARDAGLRYFEITVNDSSSSDADHLISKLGLTADGDFRSAAHWSTPSNGLGDPNAAIENDPSAEDDSNVPAYSGVGVNNTIMVAWNVTTGKLWFGKNGSWGTMGHDPAAGTLPGFTGVTGSLRPFVRYNAVLKHGVVTIRSTTAEFLYTPPAGFSAWVT